MKTLLFISLLTLSASGDLFSQCGINHKELFDKYCKGIYLTHHEIDTVPVDISTTLKENRNYSLYFLNPSAKIKEITFTDRNGKILDYKSVEELDNNQIVYTIVPAKDETYFFQVDMEQSDHYCVLWMVSYQNDFLKPGIYKSFDEMKFNNPSIKLKYDIVEKSTKYGKNEIRHYVLGIDRKDVDKKLNVYGFSDGNDIFLKASGSKLRPSTQFLKLEVIGQYYYYEEIVYSTVSTGTTTIITPVLYKRIMDMNTGEIKVLNKKTLIGIIGDNENLLREFLDAHQKDKKLKEYLVRYYEEKYE